MNIFTSSDEKLRITLLVLPDSSMMSLASALDTMRAANRIAGRVLFDWQIATLNGKTARLTCDLLIEPDIVLADDSSGDVLIVIASFNQQHHAGPAHLKLIKRVARNFSAVGGIEAGRDGVQAVMEGRYAGKVLIFPQVEGVPLVGLEQLGEHLPDVAAALGERGEWTEEAERVLFENYRAGSVS